MSTIRETPRGTYEVRITKGIPRPYYSTHSTREEASQHAAWVEALIADGQVPPSRRREVPQSPRLSAVLREYIDIAPIAESDLKLVEQLRQNLTIKMHEICYSWAESWVASMKAPKDGGKPLAPGSIRKRIECLARALDWWNKRIHPLDEMPANPLRMLPKGYSKYQDGSRRDVQRDRRVAPEEHKRIMAALDGLKRDDRERPWPTGSDAAAFRSLYIVLVGTGLRLREAYRLSPKDLDFKTKTIHVRKSKTGTQRHVPMTREVYEELKQYENEPLLVFPFWDGEDDSLTSTSSRLSARFSTLFDYAGVEDLSAHDLRHEACCRWMTMRGPNGDWMFRREEVSKILGHKSETMMARYFSLRGSDLSDRLWASDSAVAT